MRLLDFPVIFFNFLLKICSHRSIIMAMACKEIKTRYAGTFGGLLWSVINPLMMILVYWFVFSVGFKVKPPGGFPFILVFLCGLTPWVLFNDTLIGSTGLIIANRHLVTKAVFPTEILPLVNLVASLITHLIMLLILVAIMFLCGVSLDIANFQFLYYLFALSVFAVGLSWLFSALNVFYKDIGQILGVILNLWFWLTPIVWLMDMVPEKHQFLLNFNPMLYIVMGYKSAFLYHTPFEDNLGLGLYFWSVSLFFFVAGGLIFRRLKPEFVEVL